MSGAFIIREAVAADMPGVSHVRTTVTENALTLEQLAARGITNDSIAASFLADSKGWVAEQAGRIVAFSIADRATRSIFALFVLPGFEGRGLGSALLGKALDWLWANGADRVWLTTGVETKAAAFYARRGWTCVGPADHDDLRYEIERPTSA